MFSILRAENMCASGKHIPISLVSFSTSFSTVAAMMTRCEGDVTEVIETGFRSDEGSGRSEGPGTPPETPVGRLVGFCWGSVSVD